MVGDLWSDGTDMKAGNRKRPVTEPPTIAQVPEIPPSEAISR